MKKEFGVTDYKLYKNNITGVLRVAYHNVELASFIKEKANELLNYIISSSSHEKIVFLQAFFDDEGHIGFKKRVIRGYQHSIKILELVQTLLSDLEIESKINKKYFEISISKKDNIIKFQNLINFSSGLKVNGNRKNSIWKYDLEKREILKMAINSYQN